MTSWMEMLSKVIWFYIVVIQPQHLPQFGEVMRCGQLLNDFFFFFFLNCILVYPKTNENMLAYMCIIISSKMVIPFTKNK